MKKVAVVDYGMGNLNSVYNAFNLLGVEVFIASDPAELDKAEYVVLPGVGAFGDGMRKLTERGWIAALEDEVKSKGKPFLGICLGMQLLATQGNEHGSHKGLDWIPGTVELIKPADPALRIPHIGWNDIRFIKKYGLYHNLGESTCCYFVHSYVFFPQESSVISGVFSYGADFTASIEKDNIFAVQFHPEKSQKAGMGILKNFLAGSQ